MSTRQIAEQIADDLFVNGAGEKADRLALMQSQGQRPERYLGGWSKKAATDVIERALKSQPVSRSRPKKRNTAEELRTSDLTAQLAERDNIEYGHHETLPRGEHVANRRG